MKAFVQSTKDLRQQNETTSFLLSIDAGSLCKLCSLAYYHMLIIMDYYYRLGGKKAKSFVKN